MYKIFIFIRSYIILREYPLPPLPPGILSHTRMTMFGFSNNFHSHFTHWLLSIFNWENWRKIFISCFVQRISILDQYFRSACYHDYGGEFEMAWTWVCIRFMKFEFIRLCCEGCVRKANFENEFEWEYGYSLTAVKGFRVGVRAKNSVDHAAEVRSLICAKSASRFVRIELMVLGVQNLQNSC